MDDSSDLIDNSCSMSMSMTDIIAKNLAENKAFLSKLFGESAQFTSSKQTKEDTLENYYSEIKFKRRYSKRQIVEIRRNPGRKARSYAGDENTSDETTITRIPLKVKFSLEKSHNDICEDYNYGSEIEEDDVWEKPPVRKKVRLSTPLSCVVSDARKASEITDAELCRVLLDPRIKKSYTGAHLSTCHQCRQKTQDMKTICRSGFCRGVQGQFCGICLYNRYGENAKEALLDDKWSCPVCRNICNCSFCLPKKGKKCTGILVPIARKHGFTNVRSFLDSIYSKGEHSEENGSSNETSANDSAVNVLPAVNIKTNEIVKVEDDGGSESHIKVEINPDV